MKVEVEAYRVELIERAREYAEAETLLLEAKAAFLTAEGHLLELITEALREGAFTPEQLHNITSVDLATITALKAGTR